MKKLLFSLLAVTLALGAFQARAQEGAAPGGEAAAMQDLMTPGEHHKHLAMAAGDWDVVYKMWMDPAGQPVETKGTSHIELLMNGLFMQEVTQANMMGMPWEGRGIFGFDKMKNKHVGVWFDGMGTQILFMEGDCADHCSTVNMATEFVDPMTQKPTKMRIVMKTPDANHSMGEMFISQDGNEWKMMEMHYTRKM